MARCRLEFDEKDKYLLAKVTLLFMTEEEAAQACLPHGMLAPKGSQSLNPCGMITC